MDDKECFCCSEKKEIGKMINPKDFFVTKFEDCKEKEFFCEECCE